MKKYRFNISYGVGDCHSYWKDENELTQNEKGLLFGDALHRFNELPDDLKSKFCKKLGFISHESCMIILRNYEMADFSALIKEIEVQDFAKDNKPFTVLDLCKFLFETRNQLKSNNTMEGTENGNVAPPQFNFGEAIAKLKEGKKVCRVGWNGKGMYLALQPGSMIGAGDARNGAALARANELDAPAHIVIGAHIDMRAADGSVVVGWLASQTDMLSEDWMEVA